MIRVLFVCTGNICRSPTGEAVLRQQVALRGWGERIEVDSAGVAGYHVGEPPDHRSQAHAARRGLDLSGLRARQVGLADFSQFDWLLALDRSHLVALRAQCPPALRSRVCLLMDFAPDHPLREVPDPYYGGAQGFEQVLDMIELACRNFLDQLPMTGV
ncbi:low molecular weight protein-tyrosine-phosphatase [Ideonella oryzae]|uniref:protein-tyrosine-phosphatase n=1 Tax=Ideonella oryzae TaxID=2937441 RepID=A0ABT1BSF1_9BURK|nr:low molecular weight phosphotyrosine protein phosphatase [Ideonella oryzae]